LSACAPVASVGPGAWNSTFGSTTSSIVFEMNSASPLFMASWKRLSVALLVVAWAVAMWLLLGACWRLSLLTVGCPDLSTLMRHAGADRRNKKMPGNSAPA
jgi:hypothetical protein